MDYRSDIREGMTAYSSDGKKLGRVVEKQPSIFIIEKGWFFKKDYAFNYDEIAGMRGDDIQLKMTAGALGTPEEERRIEEGARPSVPSPEARVAAPVAGEARIPLVEEELEATKRQYKAGEVEIRKDVKTETAQVSIPLRHEEVHVERVATPEREAQAGEVTFEKGTVSVPVYEEEAEIRKRPVVREEVRVSKEAYTEERRASEELRRETAEVEESGELRGDKPRRE